MKKLFVIATVLSFVVSGAALANTTVKAKPKSPTAKTHQAVKTHHTHVKVQKVVSEGKAAEAAK